MSLKHQASFPSWSIQGVQLTEPGHYPMLLMKESGVGSRLDGSPASFWLMLNVQSELELSAIPSTLLPSLRFAVPSCISLDEPPWATD